MSKKRKIIPPKYCNFRFLSITKNLAESFAWETLTKDQIKVFIYIWSCLTWAYHKKKPIVTNNGEIEISSLIMMKKLSICKATSTSAIHKLIEIGLIRLTREGGNKVCHKYKILYAPAVPNKEERWKKYPEQNWLNECPKAPNNLVGKDTRFKSHPKKINRINSNQYEKLDG